MSRNKCLLGVVVLSIAALSVSRATAHPGSGIAVDERGRVYFTDTKEGLQRVDVNGRLTLVKAGGLHWMTMDRKGRFAESPEMFGTFTRLTSPSEKPTLIACWESPCAIGKDGNLYYAKENGLSIVRRTFSGQESVLVDKDKFKESRNFGVTGMACGPDGTLHLVALDSLNRTEGRGAHAIWAVNPEGTVRIFAEGFVKEKDKLPPSEQDSEVRPEYCRGISVDVKGDVYVAVSGNRCVMRLTAREEAKVVYRTIKPWAPTGVDVFKGELFVLEYDGETPAKHGDWPPRVIKVGTDGKAATLAAVTR